jgi:hypothetical protein
MEIKFFLAWVNGWVALFISGILKYEIRDDVTKFYVRRTVSDVVTRCDPSASRIHVSIILSI